MDANKLVAGWLMELWVKRPDWLSRMPHIEDVASLVERIHKEFEVQTLPPKPLNAQIAEALGWRTWEDMRPGREG